MPSNAGIALLEIVIFLFQLHNSGDLYQYINPKYEILSQIGCFLFLMLFLVQLTRIWAKKHAAAAMVRTMHMITETARSDLKKCSFILSFCCQSYPGH